MDKRSSTLESTTARRRSSCCTGQWLNAPMWSATTRPRAMRVHSSASSASKMMSPPTALSDSQLLAEQSGHACEDAQYHGECRSLEFFAHAANTLPHGRGGRNALSGIALSSSASRLPAPRWCWGLGESRHDGVGIERRSIIVPAERHVFEIGKRQEHCQGCSRSQGAAAAPKRTVPVINNRRTC